MRGSLSKPTTKSIVFLNINCEMFYYTTPFLVFLLWTFIPACKPNYCITALFSFSKVFMSCCVTVSVVGSNSLCHPHWLTSCMYETLSHKGCWVWQDLFSTCILFTQNYLGSDWILSLPDIFVSLLFIGIASDVFVFVY